MKLYRAWLYKNAPDLGLPTVNMVYHVKGFKARFSPDGIFDPNAIPDEAIIRQVAREEAAKPGEYTVINIENWPLNTPEQIAVNLPNLVKVIRIMRNEVPSLKLGYFGLVPKYDEQIVYFPEGTDYYKAWQAHNDLLQPLADVVDALFPVAYTFHSPGYQTQWPLAWAPSTRAQISECRRLCPGKPVIVFLWFQYADGSTPKELAYKFLDGAYVALQVGIVRAFADGGVIWGTGVEFDPSWEWVKIIESVNQ